MTPTQTIQYLTRLTLVEALWWFIENGSEQPPEVFFYLRERYKSKPAQPQAERESRLKRVIIRLLCGMAERDLYGCEWYDGILGDANEEAIRLIDSQEDGK